MSRTGVLLSFALSLLVPQSLAAATIIVDTTAQINQGRCTLANAIRSANANANTGRCRNIGAYGADRIVLPRGTYKLAVADHDRSGLPAITSNLTIAGNGSTITRTAGNNPPFFRIFEITAGNLTLNHLTISGGRLDIVYSNGEVDAGAGISFKGTGGLTLNNVTVTNNAVGPDRWVRGGGIGFVGPGSLILTRSAVTHNAIVADFPATFVRAEGAGIYHSGPGSLTLNRSTVADNTATSNGIDGGIIVGVGICQDTNGTPVGTAPGRLTLRDSAIIANTGTVNGGGLIMGVGVLDGGSTTISHSTIADNVANANAGSGRESQIGGVVFGVGIAALNGALTVSHSTIANNVANANGGSADGWGGAVLGAGIMSNLDATVSIEDSAIVGNRANADGGGRGDGGRVFGAGILHDAYEGGVLRISNSTIGNNVSSAKAGPTSGLGGVVQGAGISMLGGGALTPSRGGRLVLTNTTVSGNVAIATGRATLNGSNGVWGGGLFAEGPAVTLQNTIIANNSAVSGPTSNIVSDPDCSAVVTSLGHNLIGDTLGCHGLVDSDQQNVPPGLGPLFDNGNAGNAHFPLLSGSPAIGMADPAACPETDQIGTPRLLDSDGTGTDICDVGAIEAVQDTGDPTQEE